MNHGMKSIAIAALFSTVVLGLFNPVYARYISEDDIPLVIQQELIDSNIAEYGELNFEELLNSYAEWMVSQPLPGTDGEPLSSGDCSVCMPSSADVNQDFPPVRDLQIITTDTGRVKPNFKVKWRKPIRLPRALRNQYELDRYEVYLAQDNGTYELHTITRKQRSDGTIKLPKRIRFRRRDPGIYTIFVRPVYIAVVEPETSTVSSERVRVEVTKQSLNCRASVSQLNGPWGLGKTTDVNEDSTIDEVFADGVNPELLTCLGGGSADITVGEIEIVYCPYAGVTDISQLRHFSGLRWLNLTGNNIVSTDAIANLANLEILSLDENPNIILGNNLEQLDSLIVLEAAHSSLTTIPPLSSGGNFLRVHLSDNAIGDPSIPERACQPSTLPQERITVESFTISNNQLRNDDLSLLEPFNLSRLDLRENSLERIDMLVDCGFALEGISLSLDDNPLRFLDFSLIEQFTFQSLNLSSNQRVSIPTELPVVTGGIQLQDNAALKSFTGDFSQLPVPAPSFIRLDNGTDNLQCSDVDSLYAWWSENTSLEPFDSNNFFRPDRCVPSAPENLVVLIDAVTANYYLNWSELPLHWGRFNYYVEGRDILSGAIVYDSGVIQQNISDVITSLDSQRHYEFRVHACQTDLTTNCSLPTEWTGISNPLVAVNELDDYWATAATINDGLFALRWKYPDTYFTSSFRPSYFVVFGESAGLQERVTTVVAGATNNGRLWSTGSIIDIDTYSSPFFTVKACVDFHGNECGPATVVEVSRPVVIDPDMVVSDFAVSVNDAIDEITLSWSTGGDAAVDYYKIEESSHSTHGGPSISNLAFFVDKEDVLRGDESSTSTIVKKLDRTEGEYTYRITACHRDRGQPGDSCGSPVEISNNMLTEPVFDIDNNEEDQYCTFGAGSHPDYSDLEQVELYLDVDVNPGTPSPQYIRGVYRGNVNASPTNPNVAGEILLFDWNVEELRLREDSDGKKLYSGVWDFYACYTDGFCTKFSETSTDDSNPQQCEVPQGDNPPVAGNMPVDRLAPGSWWNPNMHGQGWFFYYANRLQLDATHPEYSNTYDLIAFWSTYMLIDGTWSPTWLYSKLKAVGSEGGGQAAGVYRGDLILPNGSGIGEHKNIGHLRVAPSQNGVNTDIQLVLNSPVNGLDSSLAPNAANLVSPSLGYDYIAQDGVITIRLSNLNGSQDPGSNLTGGFTADNPESHLSGFWSPCATGHCMEDNVIFLNYIQGAFEFATIFSYDLAGRPIWLNAVHCPLNVGGCSERYPGYDQINYLDGQAERDLYTLKRGFDPMRLTPSGFTHDAALVNGGFIREFTDQVNGVIEIQTITANIDNPSNPLDGRNVIISASETDIVKQANASDIRFSIDDDFGISSCGLLSETDKCTIDFTWYTDGPYSTLRPAYIRVDSSNELAALNSSFNPDFNDPELKEFDVQLCSDEVQNVPIGSDSSPVYTVENYECRVGDSGYYKFYLFKDRPNPNGGRIVEAIASSDVLRVIPFENIGDANPLDPPEPADIDPPGQPDINSVLIGATAGSFRVDESGASTYQIPIITAPGSGGVVPGISLQYSSQAGNGVAGVGWSIGGLSSIMRCGQTYVTDGNTTGVQLTTDDRLCLDGQKLIKIGSGDYWASNAEYRTEIDTIARIRSVGNLHNGTGHLTVERKDGSISEYGNTDKSRVIADNATGVNYAWAQNRVTDSTGNYIDYHYDHPNGGNNSTTPIEYQLSSVDYTGNSSIGQYPNASITFVYQNKLAAEVGIGYLAGASLTSTQRIVAIKSMVENELLNGNESFVRFYDFEYGTDPHGRSILESVSECSDDTADSATGELINCLNPTQFTWHKNKQTISSTGETDIKNRFAGTLSDEPIVDPRFGDVNGDGRMDLVYVIRNSVNDNEVYVALAQPYTVGSSPFGTFGSSSSQHFSTNLSLPGRIIEDRAWQLFDYNNDGYLDIVTDCRVNPTSRGWCGYRWDPEQTGGFADFELIGYFVGDSLDEFIGGSVLFMRVADFNGDGNSDLLYALGTDENPRLYVNFNDSSNPETVQFPNGIRVGLPDIDNGNCPIGGSCSRVVTLKTLIEVFDYNGDGAADILLQEQLTQTSEAVNSEIGLSDFDTDYIYLAPEAFAAEQFASVGSIDATIWSVVTSNRDSTFSYAEIIARGDSCDNDFSTFCDPLPEIEDENIFLVDLNGDALADLVYQQNISGSNNDRWFYQMNIGAGFENQPHAFSEAQLPLNTDRVRFIDLSGDGVNDIIWTNDDDSNSADWEILDNSYAGFAATSTSSNGLHSGNISARDISLFADITGDGKLDHLFFNYSGSSLNELYFQPGRSVEPVPVGTNPFSYQAHNVITRITDGLGALTDITYGSLTQPSVHTRSTNGMLLSEDIGSPVFDIIPSYYVVSQVESSSPARTGVMINGAVSTQFSAVSAVRYHYAGAKLQGEGRGFLGFEKIGTYDPQKSILTVTSYYQEFPFIGNPLMTEQYYQPGLPWEQSDSAPPVLPCDPDNSTCATTGFATNPVYLLSEAYNEMALRNSSAGIPYPYLRQSTEYAYSPDYDALGMLSMTELISCTQTTNTLENGDFGDIGEIVVATYNAGGCSTGEPSDLAGIDAFSRITTENEYKDNDAAKWHFGRLTKSTVRHKRSGLSEEVRQTRYKYDNTTGLLTRETVRTNDRDLRIRTTYTLDAWGNRTTARVEQVNGNDVDRTTSYRFDSRGRYVIEETNALNQITMRIPNAQNSAFPDVDIFGNPQTVENQQGTPIRIMYDDFGREYYRFTFVDGIIGTFSSITRSTNVTAACNGLNASYYQEVFTSGAPLTRTCYDVLGREIRQSRQGFAVGDWVYVDTHFSNTGQTSMVSEPYYNGDSVFWNITIHDELDRPIFTHAANGGETITSYDGLVTEVINPNLQKRVETNNVLGETIRVVDDIGGIITYGYDAIGRLVTTDGPLGSNGVGIDVTIMEYNELGHKVRMDDPDKGEWDYYYNVLGELTCQRDGRGMGSKTSYDDLGRAVSRTDRNGITDMESCSGGSIVGMTTWSYNNQLSPDGSIPSGYGQLSSTVSIHDGVENSMSYFYDELGRVSEEGTVINENGAVTFSVIERTQYDGFGRVFQQFDASGDSRGLRMRYNSNGYLFQQVEAREGVTGIAYYTILAMDARDNVIDAVHDNGVYTQWRYDAEDGQLNRIRSGTAGAGSTDVQDLTYQFDLIGNLDWRHDRSGNKDLREDFAYDTLNRLKTVDIRINGGASQRADTIDYDIAGNITSKTSNSGSYTYGYHSGCLSGSSAGPHAVCRQGNTTYNYDLVGNMVADSAGRSITYSAFNKSTRVEITATVGVTEYWYGEDRSRFQRRIEDATGLQTTYYIGNVEVQVSNGTTTYKRYLGGFAIQDVQESGSSELEYTHKDHLGSYDVITSDSGTITVAMSFSAWGERRDATSWLIGGVMVQLLRDITPRGFTGHEMVDHAGIIHMNGRIYDAKLGRFLQADPMVQAPENSQNFNRYSYVLNNPLSYTDPSGYFFKSIGNFFKNYARQFIAIGIGVATAGVASGLSFWAGFGVSVAGGAAAGYVSSGSLNGALLGAFSAGAFYGIGQYFKGIETGTLSAGTASRSALQLERIITHGFTGGILSQLQGGQFAHGFISAGVTKSFSNSIAQIDVGERFINTSLQTIAAATLGGAVSEVTGGKFANGATTSAFGYLFNQALSEDEEKQRQAKLVINGRLLRLVKGGLIVSKDGVSGFLKVEKGSFALTIDKSGLSKITVNDTEYLFEGDSIISGTGISIIGLKVSGELLEDGRVEFTGRVKLPRLLFGLEVGLSKSIDIENAFENSSGLIGIATRGLQSRTRKLDACMEGIGVDENGNC